MVRMITPALPICLELLLDRLRKLSDSLGNRTLPDIGSLQPRILERSSVFQAQLIAASVAI